MHKRLRGLLVAALVSSVTVGTLASAPPTASALTNDVVVAMIDTGVRATHQEFNYGGPTDPDDQFVAWWDFSSEGGGVLPELGQTWDPTIADPFDGNGHGTSTAAMAVGNNVANAGSQNPSLAPGFKLAVAKVGDAAGSVNGDLAAAFKWARESVGADVISMSIGAIAPLPAAINADVYREMRLAREAGIVVVVSNGNGLGGAGLVPSVGTVTNNGNSPHAIGVGATGPIEGALNTWDPEVVADNSVNAASEACDTCYQQIGGTSFSAPLVAGFAAKVMQAARDNSRIANPARVEKLVKYAARDTSVPPTHEGYGVIDAAQLPLALQHAAAGTLPTRPDPDVDAQYVETIQGTLETNWTTKTGDGLQILSRTQIGGLTPRGQIGISAPSGVAEAEVLEFKLLAGQVFTADMAYGTAPDGVTDIDVYVFRSEGDSSFNGVDLVAKSNNAADVPERVRFVATKTGVYSIAVVGWSVAVATPFTLVTSAPTTFMYQDYMLQTFGTGLIS